MNHTRHLVPRLLTLVTMGAMLLSACAPAATPTPQIVEVTREVPKEVTKIVEGTPVVVTAEPQAPAAPVTDTIKLGFIADISGVGYVFSQSQLAGLKMAVDDINAQGGILGKQVQYIVQDSQLKPDVGATIARQMILEQNVNFLLGPTSSSVALAISEVAKEHKVVVAFHTSNSTAITGAKGHPYLVQVVPNTDIEGRAAAQFAATLPYENWGFIGPDYAFGRDQYGAFAPRLTETNSAAKVVNEQWPKLADRDLTPFITALQSAGPEAVYGNLWGDQLLTFVQQAGPLGLFESTPYMGLFDTDFMKAVGQDLPEGLPGYARAPFYGVSTEQMADFVTRYKALTKDYPSDWAIMIYDAVFALKAAAEKAGTTDGEAVAKALDDLKFQSLRGELTIRACDHMANVGEYVGLTAHDPNYPFPILKDVKYIPAEETWASCEEIAKARAGQ